jgi:hypothetical protein
MRAAVALLVLAALTATACGGGHGSSSSSAGPGEARITGEVLENNHGCHRDGRCYLRVRTTGGDEVRVVYHDGESPPCHNTAAARAGDVLAVGDRVTVYGRWRGSGTERELATCASAAYTITKS